MYFKRIYKFCFLLVMSFLCLSMDVYAKDEVKDGYTVNVVSTAFFKNAYSHVSVAITPTGNMEKPGFIAIPSSIANEVHIQSVFEPAPVQSVAGAVQFDVYFPMLANLSSLKLKVFPQHADMISVNDDTPAFSYVVNITNPRAGSALMLRQEDKERNVRIFQTSGTDPAMRAGPTTADYFWIGQTTDDPPVVTPGAIVHLTEEQPSSLIRNLDIKKNGKPVPVYSDPKNGNKAHLYFTTDAVKEGKGQESEAVITVSPRNQPVGGKLIYWPFSDTSSEAARIVVYDPSIFSAGFFEPIPVKNPITISSGSSCDTARFIVLNDLSGKQNISDGGLMYSIVNDNYDNAISSSSKSRIEIEVSNKYISTKDNPNPNSIRHIYVSENGSVYSSRKRTFFVFKGIDIRRSINNVISERCLKANQ